MACPFNEVPKPVILALNPEQTVDGKQDTYRAWRTVSEKLTNILRWLYDMQTYICTLGGPSGVTAGSYTNTNLTVNAQGIITAASNGSAGAAIPTDVIVISPLAWVVPAALTEYDNSKAFRSQHDLTNATQARLCMLLASASLLLSPPTFAAQYSTNGGSTWNYMDGGTGPSILYASGFTTLVSSWITLAAGAKADVLLRIVASGGDGSTSISLGTVYLQAK